MVVYVAAAIGFLFLLNGKIEDWWEGGKREVAFKEIDCLPLPTRYVITSYKESNLIQYNHIKRERWFLG